MHYSLWNAVYVISIPNLDKTRLIYILYTQIHESLLWTNACVYSTSFPLQKVEKVGPTGDILCQLFTYTRH
jgi:hypothetical protein